MTEEDQEEIHLDIDFNKLNPTAAAEEVEKIINDPTSICGKTLRVSGEAVSSVDKATYKPYYNVVLPQIKDQYPYGIEYSLADGSAYPKDGETITVVGVFNKEDADGVPVYRIGNATVKVNPDNAQEALIHAETDELEN